MGSAGRGKPRPYKNIWRLSPCESEAVQRNRSRWNSEVGEELCAVNYWARSALGAIFDLLGELFDLLGFFYEGDGEGGACVGMVDLVL